MGTSASLARDPRIVGIGASAGGLEAIEQFIGKIPRDSKLAYIVVQHLDPTQPTVLPELLQRLTSMPVREATHGMRVEADNVYVIPPNTDLRVIANTLQLSRPFEPRGLRLPIDVLFASLASAQQARAIGVILSGMGSDGTRGAQAITAAGGLMLAQEPTTARFDSMPKSAIAAGCADIIAPAAEMPARIHAFIADEVPGATPHAEDADTILHRITRTLHERTRHDFSLYKPSTLLRRIERRMAVHGSASLADYARLLDQTVQEPDLLFKELLIGVTNFFRDPPTWEHFGETVLPELLARHCDPACPARLVRGMLDGRGSLLTGNGVYRGRGKTAYTAFGEAADIRIGSQRGCDRGRAPRSVSTVDTQRAHAGAPGTLLHGARHALSHQQQHSRDGDVCPARRRAGPALHAAGSLAMPQSADLFRSGPATPAVTLVPLQFTFRRCPDAGQFGNDRTLSPSLYAPAGKT